MIEFHALLSFMQCFMMVVNECGHMVEPQVEKDSPISCIALYEGPAQGAQGPHKPPGGDTPFPAAPGKPVQLASP